jgi:uncharacterized phage infection (PIP) family protein YhgE
MKHVFFVVLLVIPVGLGGVYLWATPSNRANKKLIIAIAAYDIAALALAHFIFKAI